MAPTRRVEGSTKMSPRSKAGLGTALTAAMIVVLGAATAQSGERVERVAYASVGGQVRPPIGWVEFCNENPKECEVRSSEPRDVVLTSTVWKDLVRVNRWVNETIQPVTDMEHWG